MLATASSAHADALWHHALPFHIKIKKYEDGIDVVDQGFAYRLHFSFYNVYFNSTI
jgi:hypothetical protein